MGKISFFQNNTDPLCFPGIKPDFFKRFQFMNRSVFFLFRCHINLNGFFPCMFSCIGYRTGNFHGLSAIFLLPYNFKIIIGKCRIGKSMTKREQDICFFCVIITVTDHHTFPVLHTVFLSKCSDRMCRAL